MKSASRVTTARSRPAALILVSTVFGCTTFGPVNPENFITARKPLDVWVTRTDSSVVHLYRPRFLGDTLTGFVEGQYHTIRPGELEGVQARRPAPGRTALLMVGGITVISVVALLVSGTVEEAPVADTGAARIVGL